MLIVVFNTKSYFIYSPHTENEYESIPKHNKLHKNKTKVKLASRRSLNTLKLSWIGELFVSVALLYNLLNTSKELYVLSLIVTTVAVIGTNKLFLIAVSNP